VIACTIAENNPKYMYFQLIFCLRFCTKYVTSLRTVPLKKLTFPQLVKKFPTFFGCSLPRSQKPTTCPIQNHISVVHPHPIFWISIFILSSHLRLGLPSGQGFIQHLLCCNICGLASDIFIKLFSGCQPTQ
jgi:hypothetical protein